MSSEDIDGELTEARATAVMDHLALCRDCKSDYELTCLLRDKLKEDLSLSPLIPVPTGFSRKIVDIIEKQSAPETYAEPYEANEEVETSSFFSRLLAMMSLRPLSASAALPFSVAAALVLIVSFSLYYNQSSNDNLSSLQLISEKPEMTDATKLNTKILKVKNSPPQTEDESLNFYAKKHAETTYSRSVYTPNSGLMKRASFPTSGGYAEGRIK